MTPTTTLTNGKPHRKQLSDQLDRLDRVIDAVLDGLPDAVATATREGTRQAIRDVLTEVRTDPDVLSRLRTTLLSVSPPPLPPTPSGDRPVSPSVPKPDRFDRFKSAVRSGYKKVVEEVNAVATPVNAFVARTKQRVVTAISQLATTAVNFTTATRVLNATLPLRRFLVVALAVCGGGGGELPVAARRSPQSSRASAGRARHWPSKSARGYIAPRDRSVFGRLNRTSHQKFRVTSPSSGWSQRTRRVRASPCGFDDDTSGFLRATPFHAAVVAINRLYPALNQLRCFKPLSWPASWTRRASDRSTIVTNGGPPHGGPLSPTSFLAISGSLPRGFAGCRTIGRVDFASSPSLVPSGLYRITGRSGRHPTGWHQGPKGQGGEVRQG